MPDTEVLFVSEHYIDSVDVSLSGEYVIAGLSSLEGNYWDGGLQLLSSEGESICGRKIKSGISTVRFIGSNDHILAARDDGDIAVYSPEKLDMIKTYSFHHDIVSCIAANPHAEIEFASCSWDGSIGLWDLNYSKKPVFSYMATDQGHVNEITYSPGDRNALVSVGWDGLVRLFDLRDRRSNFVNVGQISTCVSYDNTDQWKLLVGLAAGDICVIDSRKSGSAAVINSTKVHKGRVRRIAASPRGFVSASDDTTLVTFSAEKNGKIFQIER